jgi:methylmalonyl-CoA mutase cobalamin-binding subunit
VKVLGASIGSDVHTAGLVTFLNVAKQEGYETVNLGGAVPVEKVVETIEKENPDIVAISYRLGREPLKKLLAKFFKLVDEKGLENRKFIFGGTIETGEVAREFGRFDEVFDGRQEIEDLVMVLRGEKRRSEGKEIPPQTLWERVEYKKPYPLFRHHIGLPTMEETIEEIKKLADSGLLDVISLAPDQNAQQYFFEPKKMDPAQDGAGGAPIRSVDDFKRLYEATRRGNYPLVRCYSGTRNLVRMAKVLKETINNAWAAIPVFWYSELDRRSERPLEDAIRENLEAIKWNADNGVPVEINDAHQWGLRFAHDALVVADTYIITYIAKKLGVRHYVQQYMLMTPHFLSPKYDIAKNIAMKEIVKSFEDENFKSYTMIRAGLLSMPADEHMAMGQLVSEMFYGAYLKPDIVHVVAYSEAIERARSKEIIESVKMTRRALSIARMGLPDFISDPEIKDRVEELKEAAMTIIQAVRNLGESMGSKDPLLDPKVLSKAVREGILDAMGLSGSGVAPGNIKIDFSKGKVDVIDENGNPLPEKERLRKWL